MEDLSEPIFKARQAFCKNILPYTRDYYDRICSGREQIDIQYRSDLSRDSLGNIFRESRERDKLLKYTSCGIQRDDFLFSINSMPIRYCGSQGQKKSFLVALKFSQYDVMGKTCRTVPTLLLDDLFDKFDPHRVEKLLSIVSDKAFGQIFITDPDISRTREIVDSLASERAYFIAKGGTFHRDE